MLQAQNLSFERNQKLILSKVNFSIQPGEALQIIGANGSGKTTLLRLLSGLLPLTEGKVFWQNVLIQTDLINYRASFHFISHFPGVKNSLTVKENLEWFCSLRPQDLCCGYTEALQHLGLQGKEQQFTFTLSAGQQKRLLLTKLILQKAPIWYLDEPFTALDKDSMCYMETLIQDHLAAKGIIVFSSHQAFNLPKIILKNLILNENHN